MHDHDELDRLVDLALTTYADPGPDSGLEQRVLLRIAGENRLVPALSHLGWFRTWRSLAIAAPLAACAILLIFAVSRFFHPSPQPPTVTRQIIAPAQSTHGSTSALTAHSTDLHEQNPVHHRPKSLLAMHRALQASLPKLDQFPAPQPLTQEEKALIALATQYPNRAGSLFADHPPQEPEPLTIVAIKIAPIETPSPGDN